MQETFEQKCDRNARVQARWDELMREGRHGHYETLFRVVREEVERACAEFEDPKSEPRAWIVNSVKNPSKHGTLVQPFEIGSYQRESLTREPLYTHPSPVAEEAKDGGRLDWMLRKLSGDAIRACVGEISDTSNGAEFRSAIDAAMAKESQA